MAKHSKKKVDVHTDSDASSDGGKSSAASSAGGSDDEKAPINKKGATADDPVIAAEVADPKHAAASHWIKRNLILYYILAGIAPALSVAAAILLGVEQFGMPVYVWVPTLAMNILEALIVAGSLYFIHSKKFATDAWDMSAVTLAMWCGVLASDLSACWGAGSDTTDTMWVYVFWGLCGASRLFSLVSVFFARRYHLLLLKDPDAASNDKQKKRYKRRAKKAHRHSHNSSDSE